MKPRLFPLAFGTLILLMLGTFALGCDGNDEDGLTLEEYFQQFEALGDKADEQLDALHETSSQEFDSEDDELAAYRDFVIAGAKIQRDFIEALDDISPPPEAEAAHRELVQALPESSDLLVDRVMNADSFSELGESADPAFEVAIERSDQACSALQDIADAYGIDVGLAKYCS